MESGTLDFEDLMDTGDEYPGFEIAKFTPANVKDDDSVLRTPEHKSDDDNDALDSMAKGDVRNQQTDQQDSTPDVPVSKEHVNGLSGDQELPSNHAADQNKVEEMPSEPPEKKKKLYLQPPKPKMRLWDSSKHKNKHEDTSGGGEGMRSTAEPAATGEGEPTKNTESQESNDEEKSVDGNHKMDVDARGDDSNDSKSNSSRDSGSMQDSPMPEKENKSEEKDNPHQQSFLSFLNLQPGASKTDLQLKEKKKQQERDFFSRKRLRIRKKVSYVEDVQDDKDESYNEDEEEEDELDHQIGSIPAIQRRRRSNSGKAAVNAATAAFARALTNAVVKSPVQSPSPVVAPHKMLQMQMLQQQQQAQQLLNESRNTTPTRPPPGAVIADLSSGTGVPTGQIKGLFECGLCGTFFNTASQFISHQDNVHKEANQNGKSGMETFRCEICQFVLTNRFAYLEHKRMKHMKSQVAFSCNKCSRSFAYMVDLQKHKETCGMPGPYCSICKMKFLTVMHLEVHKQKVHSNTSVVTKQWLNCVNKDCTFKCLTQHEMKLHIQNKHMISDLFPCNAPRCSRIFNSREALNEHKKEQHASEFIVQYQCMECKMCFSSKTLLAEHQYLHTMDKMRKCDICNRQFASFNLLRKHKEVHACKGKLQCTACLRWCFDKVELINHVCQEKRQNKTVGMRLYFCDICRKDFRSDDKLFSHRREHKRYYQCNSCFWDCDNEEDYFEHREKHGIFTCNECCDELSTEGDLIAHKKAHKFYVKMVEDSEEEDEGESQRFMYLCPNLLDMING